MSDWSLSQHSHLSDSTSSLLSILDHDDLEEDNPVTSEGEGDGLVVISPVRLQNAPHKTDEAKCSATDPQRPENKDEEEPKPVETESPDNATATEPVNDDSVSVNKSPSPQKLTPWEKWFIEKMEKERRRKRKERLTEKQKEILAEQKAKDKEAFRKNLEEKAVKLANLQKKRESKLAAIKRAQLDEEKYKAEESKQKSTEAYRKWVAKKHEEIAKQQIAEKQKGSIIKQISAQKRLLAQQAFNDWQLTKQLSEDSTLQKSRFFSTPHPPISLPAWRGQVDTDSLPLDFSTRLFLSRSNHEPKGHRPSTGSRAPVNTCLFQNFPSARRGPSLPSR